MLSQWPTDKSCHFCLSLSTPSYLHAEESWEANQELNEQHEPDQDEKGQGKVEASVATARVGRDKGGAWSGWGVIRETVIATTAVAHSSCAQHPLDYGPCTSNTLKHTHPTPFPHPSHTLLSSYLMRPQLTAKLPWQSSRSKLGVVDCPLPGQSCETCLDTLQPRTQGGYLGCHVQHLAQGIIVNDQKEKNE